MIWVALVGILEFPMAQGTQTRVTWMCRARNRTSDFRLHVSVLGVFGDCLSIAFDTDPSIMVQISIRVPFKNAPLCGEQ